MAAKTIIPTLLLSFPDVPKTIFEFSSDNLTEKEKYLEIKMFMKHFNEGENYWDYSQEISNFLVRLYYNNVISIEELFQELFIDKHYCNPYRFIEHCNCDRIFFGSKSIIDYMDFRMGLVKELNRRLKEDPDSLGESRNSITDSYNLNKILNLYDDNYKTSIIERYEESITELIIQIVYNSFYEDEMCYVDKLIPAVRKVYSEELLIDKLDWIIRIPINDVSMEKVLYNYSLNDFMLLYLFIDDFDGPQSENVNMVKFKQILKKVYEKRGIE